MLKLTCIVFCAVVLTALQSGLYVLSHHPEFTWEGLHYFLDRFFWTAYALPRVLVTSPGSDTPHVVSPFEMYLYYHLPLMLFYGLLFGTGLCWLMQWLRRKG